MSTILTSAPVKIFLGAATDVTKNFRSPVLINGGAEAQEFLKFYDTIKNVLIYLLKRFINSPVKNQP